MGAGSLSHHDTYTDLMPLFDNLADPTLSGEARSRLRDRLITGFTPLAEHIARRFVGRGQPDDDLRQVALVGLIGAVDRFDPARGVNFIGFAVPTITGKLKRHFRDTAWAVHVPRRLKELHRAIRVATEELAYELGRAPRPSDLAKHLGLSIEEVQEGLQVSDVMAAESLDATVRDGQPFHRPAEAFEHQVDIIADRVSLYPALAKLPERDALVVVLRFFEGLSQTQIASRVGVSQMQVSRVLTKSLAVLRDALSRPPADNSAGD